MSNVAIIGNGNVGHHFAKHIAADHNVSVFSRNRKEGVRPLDNFDPSEYNFALLTVPDDLISKVANSIDESDCIIVHTSGSRPLFDLAKHKKTGVIYPLQTFSLEKEIDFNSFSIFIEGTSEVEEEIASFVKSFSSDVRLANSTHRAKIHLAAVFACNFTNHMYAISDSILDSVDMSFVDLQHLAQETLNKAASISPSKAQTGPAIRNDIKTMSSQLNLIDSEESRKIYELISKDIRKAQQ